MGGCATKPRDLTTESLPANNSAIPDPQTKNVESDPPAENKLDERKNQNGVKETKEEQPSVELSEPKSEVANPGESAEPKPDVPNPGESAEPKSEVPNTGELAEPKSEVPTQGESAEPKSEVPNPGKSAEPKTDALDVVSEKSEKIPDALPVPAKETDDRNVDPLDSQKVLKLDSAEKVRVENEKAALVWDSETVDTAKDVAKKSDVSVEGRPLDSETLGTKGLPLAGEEVATSVVSA